MTRLLALLLIALAAPATAAQRNFTITSFDRIRVEAPFEVVVTTGKPPSARAESTPDALDTVDLRVEGRTLIVRQQSGWNGQGRGVPVRVTLGTPDLASALLTGSGRLLIDRMKGLSVNLGLGGPGQLQVASVTADRLDLLAAGSGTVTLAGTIKNGRIGAEGSIVLDAAALQSDDLVLVAAGSSEVRASARRSANVTATGAATVTFQNPVACTRKVTGGATVTNCR